MPTEPYIKNTSPQGMVLEYDVLGSNSVVVSYSRVSQDQDAVGIAWWVFQSEVSISDAESLRHELFKVKASLQGIPGYPNRLLASGTKKSTSSTFSIDTTGWPPVFLLVVAPVDQYNILGQGTIDYYNNNDAPFNPGAPEEVIIRFTHDLDGVESYGISVDRVQTLTIATGSALTPDRVEQVGSNLRYWFFGSADRVDLYHYDSASCVTRDSRLVCNSLVTSNKKVWLEYDTVEEQYYVDIRLGPGLYKTSFIAFEESPIYGNGYPVPQTTEEIFFSDTLDIPSDAVLPPSISSADIYQFVEGGGGESIVAVWTASNVIDGAGFSIEHTSGTNTPIYEYSGNYVTLAGPTLVGDFYVFAFPVDSPLALDNTIVTIGIEESSIVVNKSVVAPMLPAPQELLDYIKGRVQIGSTGIYGWNSAGEPTFNIGSYDGSGFIGREFGGNISWSGNGYLSVDGAILTQSISAANFILREDPAFDVGLPYKLPSAIYTQNLYDLVIKDAREIPVGNTVAKTIAQLIPNIPSGVDGMWAGYMQPPEDQMEGVLGGDSPFEFFVGGRVDGVLKYVLWDGDKLNINGSTVIGGGGSAVSAGKGEISGVIIGGTLSTQGIVYEENITGTIPIWAQSLGMTSTYDGRAIYFGDMEFLSGGPSIDSYQRIDYSSSIGKDFFIPIDITANRLGYSAFDQSAFADREYVYLLFEKDVNAVTPGTTDIRELFKFAYIDSDGQLYYQDYVSGSPVLVPETDKALEEDVSNGITYTTKAGPYVLAEFRLSNVSGSYKIVEVDWFLEKRTPGFYRYNIYDQSITSYSELADPANFDKYATEFFSKGINGQDTASLGDVLTITNTYNDGLTNIYPTVSKVYLVNETTGVAEWQDASVVIDGNLIVDGTIKAKQLSAYEASMVLQKAGIIYSRRDVNDNYIGHVVDNDTNSEYTDIIDEVDSEVLYKINNAKMVINLDAGYIHIR